MAYEKTEKGYFFSNDKNRLQPEVIHGYLSNESYWAQNIELETIQAFISRSDCFGIYHNEKQVGFARLVTDGVIFGYLADVFIVPEHRGKGLSKTLMDFIMNHEPYKRLKRILLRTRDAHGLYAQCGFKPLSEPGALMEIQPSDLNKP